MLTLCGRVGVRRGAAALPSPGSEEKATVWHRRANRSRRTLTLSLQHHILSLLRRSRDLADLIASRYSTANRPRMHHPHAYPFRPACVQHRTQLSDDDSHSLANKLGAVVLQHQQCISTAFQCAHSTHTRGPSLETFHTIATAPLVLAGTVAECPIVALQTAHTHT